MPLEWDKIPLDRIELINHIISKRNLENYLEIGCQNDVLFKQVNIKNKVGVDPVSGGTIRLTSDNFFKDNEKVFDIIFIDGLHKYDQLRRDVLNSLKFIKKDGWILIHDLIPRDWLEEHIPRINSNWCGDIWKISFELINTEGIDFNIFLIDMGVGVIKVNEYDITLKDDYENLKKMRYKYFVKNYHKLPLKTYDEIKVWIVDKFK